MSFLLDVALYSVMSILLQTPRIFKHWWLKKSELLFYFFTFRVLHDYDCTADGLKLSGINTRVKETICHLRLDSRMAVSKGFFVSPSDLTVLTLYLNCVQLTVTQMSSFNSFFLTFCHFSCYRKCLCPEERLSPASEVNTLCSVLPKEGNVAVQKLLVLLPGTWSLEQ